LHTAAQVKFQNAEEPLDLRHFDSEELGSFIVDAVKAGVSSSR
jgi:hypothetical protein